MNKQYHLYTKDLFSWETDTKLEQSWVYRGIVKDSPKRSTTTSAYVAVQPQQEATK